MDEEVVSVLIVPGWVGWIGGSVVPGWVGWIGSSVVPGLTGLSTLKLVVQKSASE